MQVLKESVMESIKEKNILLEDIKNRVDYILKYIVEVIGGEKVKWWRFGSGVLSNGEFLPNCDRDMILISGDFGNKSWGNLGFLDKKGHFWALEGSIPLRWLWEDFEDEYKNGRERYLSKQKENTQRNKK